MALVYNRTDEKTARAYERSPGMEPNRRRRVRSNPGVTHMTVVRNSGRPRGVSESNRRSGMAYNIGALRKAMRSNPRRRRRLSVNEEESAAGVKLSSRGKTTKNRRRRKSRRGSKRRSRAGARGCDTSGWIGPIVVRHRSWCLFLESGSTESAQHQRRPFDGCDSRHCG